MGPEAILFRYRREVTPSGVTRSVVRDAARAMSMTETEFIHRALVRAVTDTAGLSESAAAARDANAIEATAA